MWEGDPVGVDQKRPLVGFAVVAVLCAVLMGVSIGRGSAITELFGPGRPIAAPAEHTLGEPRGDATVPRPTPVAVPAELSAQPLGVAVGSPVVKRSGAGSPSDSQTTGSEPAVPDPSTAGRTEQNVERAAARAARLADLAAASAARLAEKAAAKAERTADKAAHRAAEKAQRRAERAQEAAAKAELKAARATAKAERKAVRAAEKAAAEAARSAAKAERDAARQAEKLARVSPRSVPARR
jgi:hypothetical protein